MNKDVKRYSHSRLTEFKQCPLKHNYNYVEGIATPESATTIPGSLFHLAIEKYLSGEDMTPVFEEFKNECLSGKLDLEPDLLEYVVNLYLDYYKTEFIQERCIGVEKEYKETLEDDDYFVLKVDEIYERNGITTVRDHKTTLNALKYTTDTVRFNQQLLLYVLWVEEDMNIKVDSVEIDEVRIAKLQSVPLLKNGKPSVNKNLLSLVTYEAYYDLLASMGLENDSEFKPILEYLEQRGHPLFRRVNVQLLDRQILDSISDETYYTYKQCKNISTNGHPYRTVGPLCNYCAYYDLCKLDYYKPDSTSRDMIIQKINKNVK